MELTPDAEPRRIILTEMPEHMVLEDFINGVMGGASSKVIFDIEQGTFIRVGEVTGG